MFDQLYNYSCILCEQLISQQIAMNLAYTDKSVFQVTIELTIASATTNIRFPSLFSVQWRTNNQKVSVETDKHSPQGARTDFNKKLVMKTQVGFDKNRKSFLKKETQVQLNLTSKNRPDQSKLVGRVTIDLATILNDGIYSQPTEFALQFCSVNAFLVMSFRTISKIQTDLSISELELSYGESLTFNSALRLVPTTNTNKQPVASSSNDKSDFLEILKKELISPLSPQSVDPISREISSPKQKQSVSSISEIRNEVQQKLSEIKPATRSFKNNYSAKQSTHTKKSQATDDLEGKVEEKKSYFNKMGSNSDISECGKLSEQIWQKTEMVGSKQSEQVQVQKTKQQCELLKLQLKLKKSSLDQAVIEASTYKAQLVKTREQISRNREESVALNLKLAELRQSHNVLLVKSSTTERQLAKLQAINQKYQQLRKENENLLAKFNQSQALNNDLKNTLNHLDQMHQEALSKCNQHQEALVYSQDSFSMVNQKLAQEIKEKITYQTNIEELNKEIGRLQKLAMQLGGSNSEHIKQIEKCKEDLLDKKARIQQLQDQIIDLDSQIQFYSQQNNSLNEKYSLALEDADNLRLQAQRIELSTKDIISKQMLELKKLNDSLTQFQGEGLSAKNELSSLHEACSALEKEHKLIKDQYDSLKQEHALLKHEKQVQQIRLAELQTSLQELASKSNEMQELVLNINQLREKEREDFTSKENYLNMVIAGHEASIQQLQSILQSNSQKMGLVEEQLKGRQNLIVRLQQGLNGQVERSECLSQRVMGFMEKEERMRETIGLLQEECGKVSALLHEQQLKEENSKQQLRARQIKIEQLTTSYNDIVRHIQQVQEEYRVKQNSFIEREDRLAQQLQAKQKQIIETNSAINRKEGQLQSSLKRYNQLQQRLSKEQSSHQILIAQYNELRCSKDRLDDLLLIKQSKIQSLQGQIQQKFKELSILQSSLQGQAFELNLITQEVKGKELKHEQEMRELGRRYELLSEQYDEREHERVVREEQFLQQTNALQLQISQLKLNSQALEKQITSFNINHYKEEIKKKNQEISLLQSKLKSAQVELSKIPTLERALKIKSIQLSSLKFKGKLDGSAETQLCKLKDEQISTLRLERDSLVEQLGDYQVVKEKNDALVTELQLLQEQKFNIESLSNERALQLQETKQQNKKLLNQITIIGQRNCLLEKSLQDLILNQTIKQNPHTNPNMTFIYQSLKNVIESRAKSRQSQKIMQLIKRQEQLSYEELAQKKGKKQALSKQFQKLKAFVLKSYPKSAQKQTTKLLPFFKDYEQLLSDF